MCRSTVKSKFVSLHAIKTYVEVKVQLHPVLTSGTIAGDWSDSRPGRFNPLLRSPGSHLIGCWVRLRTGVSELEKR
jgi:hypothetical protein